jgi:methyltransferase family protein
MYSPGVPTMITPEECSYLKWLGSEVWRDRGNVFEMGPWLGGSTLSLAAGMKCRGKDSEHRLHVYDNFVWRSFMSERARLPLKEGDSFRPYFEENLRAYRDLVVVHEASLPDEAVDGLAIAVGDIDPEPDRILKWNDGPIEIIFIDGAKTWKGLLHLLRETVGSLEPGALVVCQDYKYSVTYWVALIMELLEDHFSLEHVLSRNTVTFRLRRRISVTELDDLPDMQAIDRETGLKALSSAAARLREHGDSEGEFILKAAKVRFLGNIGDMAGALHVFREVEGSWPIRAETLNLERARTWLTDERGGAVPLGQLYRLRRLPRRAVFAVRR